MQFLTNPEWISVIIATLSGIIIPTVLLLIQRRKGQGKQITTEIISNKAVVSIDQEVMSKVQATFNRRPIGDVRLIYLRMINTGNEPIDLADYASNTEIKFDFGNQAEILEAEVSETIPSTIKSAVIVTNNPGSSSVTLKPFLLKSQESVTLKITVASFENEIQDETRLIGAKQILKARLFDVPSFRNLIITFITLIIACPLLFVYVSVFIYQAFLSNSLGGWSKGIDLFYTSDLIGSIIASFVIFIVYSVISYLLPTYISTTKQFIKLNKGERDFVRNFLIISSVLLLGSPLAYALITFQTARYLEETFHIYLGLPSFIINPLNTADGIGSILSTIVIIIGIYFLNKYFPIKVFDNNK